MDLREVLVRALRGPFCPREELWLFPADAELGDGRPTRLSAPTHPPGWETWPDELKELHQQFMHDRETAVALITRKNRLVARRDEVQRKLSEATDLATRRNLQNQLDALEGHLRSAQGAVEELKVAVRQKERTVRLTFSSYKAFQVTDISALNSEQRAQIERQLDDLEAKANSKSKKQ